MMGPFESQVRRLSLCEAAYEKTPDGKGDIYKNPSPLELKRLLTGARPRDQAVRGFVAGPDVYVWKFDNGTHKEVAAWLSQTITFGFEVQLWRPGEFIVSFYSWGGRIYGEQAQELFQKHPVAMNMLKRLDAVKWSHDDY